MESLIAQGADVLVPAIVDYEIRRELLRAGKPRGVERLDQFCAFLGYLPLTTAALRTAAGFWASARKIGKPASDDASLDVDMILCAQAAGLALDGFEPVIATANVRHLALFANASNWRNIR